MARDLFMAPLKEPYPEKGFKSYYAMSEWCHRNDLFVLNYVWDTRVVGGTIYYYFTEW